MKILIIEDCKILLDGIASSLMNVNEFKIVGKLTNAKDILAFLTTETVDIILSDVITENSINSLDYIKQIKEKYPNIKIIMMTGMLEISFIKKAKELGADSFIYKNIDTAQLINTIKSTYFGYNIFPADTTLKHNLNELSTQEIEVLRLYCTGYDRKEIAKKMFVAESTIRNYITSMLSKTGFPSISRLAIYTVNNKLILLDDSNI